MTPGSGGGARHLRESRWSGHVSNHNHENPPYQSATPKATLGACARFCSASSYQIMQLMISPWQKEPRSTPSSAINID
jgi:hypothetical protein